MLRGASLLGLALALGGCSARKDEPETRTELTLQPALNLGECSSSWIPITGGNRSDSEPPAELLFSRGELFFFRFQWGPDRTTSSDLVKYDVHSPSRELATTVLVSNAYSAPMWVDDGDLVFTQNGEVHSVPMSGGDVRVRSSFGSVQLGDIRWLGISDGNFYFARYGQPGAVWKVNLSGGPVMLFADLGPDWGYQMEPPLVQSEEGLLMNGPRQGDDGADRPVTIVISGDGAVRELPYPEGSKSRPFLTPGGVIHIVDPPRANEPSKTDSSKTDSSKTDSSKTEPAPPTGPTTKIGAATRAAAEATGAAATSAAAKIGVTPGKDDATSAAGKIRDAEDPSAAHPDLQMWLAPLRGTGLSEFWPDRPASAVPGHVESDGRDGWYVTATEPFNDGFLHDTLWHVRPNAEARRLACNPSPESSQIQTDSRTGHAFAYGDGFVYLVSLRGGSEFWELVQISYLLPEEQND